MKDILENTILSLTEHIRLSTCQLFINKKPNSKEFMSHGCGVLLAHGDKFFLLSSAHVFDESPLGVPFIFKSSNETISIGGRQFTSTIPEYKTRADDKLDIIVFDLNKDSINALLNTGYKFITLNYIESGFQYNANDYAIIMGYPSSRAKINPTQKTIDRGGMHYVSNFVNHDLSQLGFNPDYHLVAKYPIKNFKHKTADSLRIRGPQPLGLSGSGLWVLKKNRYFQEEPKLVGILTEYNENRSVVISTRIDFFVEVLRQKFDPYIVNKGIKVEYI